ncbi:4'-phosphopantetheinyl transferase [Microbacterium halimionae]|uniref:4'-phosphopantetheinyl transferase n=1 Tax=Microbacterium halimionae TaxID=1526413 RepID=A0A7W3JMJ2_9MICO|nr:chemotaxis protein CheY [Microbacterium halimionae]MBA8815612.1 4'-phosphopantetheinyl transferase [Microbacterium halimionae]NII95659.1 4'-phosphopantetheinyl transferase [Microbacterium halimionae]
MRSDVRVAWGPAPERRSRRDAAWLLLGGLIGDSARISTGCARCGGDHGPVRISGAALCASVSYAGGLAIVAVADSRSVASLGIDAEATDDPIRSREGYARALGRASATVTDWVRVEAALKADGRGLRVDPRSVEVTGDADAWTAVVPGSGAFQGWDFPGPAGIAIGIATYERATQNGAIIRSTCIAAGSSGVTAGRSMR